MEAEQRKLIKFSNYSLCVTLPKWVIRELGWQKGELIDMQVDSKAGQIVISKNAKKKAAVPKTAPAKTTPVKAKGSKSSLRW